MAFGIGINKAMTDPPTRGPHPVFPDFTNAKYNSHKKQLALATEEEYYLEAEMRLSADNRPGFDSQIVTLRYSVVR